MSQRDRPPAVAGSFYPEDPEELRGMVRALLGDAGPPPAGTVPKALVVPHAGYVYSGPVAAAAYARVAPARGRLTRVVLLGPAHLVPLHGLAAPSTGRFRTPLGPVSLDRRALEDALSLPGVRESDRAHAREHSLEVQLPFLQETLGEFLLAPLVAGDVEPGWVAAVLERLWGGPETLVVISSDLSHYLDDESARRRDAATRAALEALAPERIGPGDACGSMVLCGLLEVARRRGLALTALDLRNSGDTTGPRDRVVGYGAFACG